MGYNMLNMKTILVVDDKLSVRSLLKDHLTEEGFAVITAKDGREALDIARREKTDLILLDLMMPEMGGYEFIRTFRKESDTPIIILTAKIEETDKVLGLEIGADDYVTKPFGMRELTARIHARLRKTEKTKEKTLVISIHDLTLDLNRHSLTVRGEKISLTPSEFDLLHILMSAPERVFSRSDLLLKMQGSTFEGVERTIDVHIRNLRVKIERDPSHPRYIKTVFGVGYGFSKE
jgi:two-component system, OmpR family, alkaline phosphatase synthesis response regulator PhoP